MGLFLHKSMRGDNRLVLTYIMKKIQGKEPHGKPAAQPNHSHVNLSASDQSLVFKEAPLPLAQTGDAGAQPMNNFKFFIAEGQIPCMRTVCSSGFTGCV